MFYERIKKEIKAYDNLAINRLNVDVARLTSNMIGSDLVESYLSGAGIQFPKSSRLWIDSVGNPITQITAYD